MSNDTNAQVRLAIKEIIKTLYPTAQVYAWNALSHDLDEWAGMFRTSDGKTHGWIIKEAAQSSTWKNGRRDRKKPVFDVWGFYLFRSGNESDNSDNEFSLIRSAIYEAVKDAPHLNFQSTVETHDLLQFLRTTTLRSGEETLHFAQGQLTVHLCC